MNLHEYQAKALLKKYGLPVPDERVAKTVDEVVEIFTELGGGKAVVKAQVHAGGRGKAGGVKVVENLGEAREVASTLLGSRLVTPQTDSQGQPVNAVLVCENLYPVKRELYLGAVVDRGSERITFIASTEGGMEIEEVAEKSPDKILKVVVDPLVGLQPHQARFLGYKLRLSSKQIGQFVSIALGAYKAFIENDIELFEINPLSVQLDDSLICIDAKISIDDNARYRQSELVSHYDRTQENEYELKAAEYGLSYISLNGNIGCMVNGAGLAMATMDIIQIYGAEPANFLDVGGGATNKSVMAAFNLILSDPKVKGILINIFGGIVRGDMVAEAVIKAVKEKGLTLPIVIRLDGNNAEKGLQLIKESHLNLIIADDLADAAKKIVQAVA